MNISQFLLENTVFCFKQGDLDILIDTLNDREVWYMTELGSGNIAGKKPLQDHAGHFFQPVIRVNGAQYESSPEFYVTNDFSTADFEALLAD